jgi:hypothetical protein
MAVTVPRPFATSGLRRRTQLLTVTPSLLHWQRTNRERLGAERRDCEHKLNRYLSRQRFA